MSKDSQLILTVQDEIEVEMDFETSDQVEQRENSEKQVSVRSGVKSGTSVQSELNISENNSKNSEPETYVSKMSRPTETTCSDNIEQTSSSELSVICENIKICDIESVIDNVPTLFEENIIDTTENKNKKRKINQESKNVANGKKQKVNDVTKTNASPQKSNYHCTYCPRYFRSSKMLNVHVKIEHSEVIESDNTGRKKATLHYCPICNVCYNKKFVIYTHIVQSHPSEANWALDHVQSVSHQVGDVKSSVERSFDSNGIVNSKSITSLRVNVRDINLGNKLKNVSTKSIPNKIKASSLKCSTKKGGQKSNSPSKTTGNTCPKTPAKSASKSQTIPTLKVKLSSNKTKKCLEKPQSSTPSESMKENMIEGNQSKSQLESHNCPHCEDMEDNSNLMIYHKLKEHSQYYKLNVVPEVANKVIQTRFFCTECQSHFSCANDCAFHIKKSHHNIDNISSKIEVKKSNFWLCTMCHKNCSFKYFTKEVELLKHAIDHHEIDFNQYIEDTPINKKTIVTASFCPKCKIPYWPPSKFRSHMYRKHREIYHSIKKIERRKMCLKRCKHFGCKKQFFYKSKLSNHEELCTYNENHLYVRKIDYNKIENYSKNIDENEINTINIQMDTKYFCRKYFKRYRCPKCSLSFESKSHCMEHLLSYHNSKCYDAIKSGNMLLWSCKICNTGNQVLNCYSNLDMTRHLFTSHNITGTIDEEGNFHEKDSLHETQLIDTSILNQAMLSAGINSDNDGSLQECNLNKSQDDNLPNLEIDVQLIESDTTDGIVENNVQNVHKNNTPSTSNQVNKSSEKCSDNNKKRKELNVVKRFKKYKSQTKNYTQEQNDSIYTKLKLTRYFCNLCYDNYTSLQNLDKHTLKKHGSCKQMNVNSKEVIAWKCNICMVRGKSGRGMLVRNVTNEKEMEEHFQTKHNLIGNIKENGDFIENGTKVLLSNISNSGYVKSSVNACIITSCSVFSTEKHMRYYCNHCDNNYTTRKNLEIHVLKQHGSSDCSDVKTSYGTAWRCKVCNSSRILHHVNNNEEMLLHLKAIHLLNGTIDETGNFIEENNAYLSNQSNVINLGKNVFSKEIFQRFVCSICSKQFIQKINCIAHMKRMHSNKKYNVIKENILLWKCFLCKNDNPLTRCNNKEDMENHVKLEHELTGYIDGDDNFIQTIIAPVEDETAIAVQNIEIENSNLIEKEFELEATNLLNEFQNTNIVIIPNNIDTLPFNDGIIPSQDLPEIIVDFSKIATTTKTVFYCPVCDLEFSQYEPVEKHIKTDHADVDCVPTCKNIVSKITKLYVCELCSDSKYLPNELSFKLHIQKYHLEKLKNGEIKNDVIAYNETLNGVDFQNNIVNEVSHDHSTGIVNVDNNLVELMPECSTTMELIETEIIQFENLIDMEYSNVLHIVEGSSILDCSNVVVGDCNVQNVEVNDTNIDGNSTANNEPTKINVKSTEVNIDNVTVVFPDELNIINEDVLLQELTTTIFACPLCPILTFKYLADIQNHITKKHSGAQPPVLFETKEVPFWSCNICKEAGLTYGNIYNKSIFLNHLMKYHNIHVDNGTQNSEVITNPVPSNSTKNTPKKVHTKNTAKKTFTKNNKPSACNKKSHEIVKQISEPECFSRRRTSKWTCNICNKNFKDKYTLLDHKDIVHYNTESITTKKKVVTVNELAPSTSSKTLILKLKIPKDNQIIENTEF